MRWFKLFHSMKDETFHSTRWSWVKWYISSFTEWKYLFPLHECKTFIIFILQLVQRFKFFIQIWSKKYWKTTSTKSNLYAGNITQALASRSMHALCLLHLSRVKFRTCCVWGLCMRLEGERFCFDPVTATRTCENNYARTQCFRVNFHETHIFATR